MTSGLSTAQRNARNIKLIREKLRGRSIASLAEKYDLSEDSVKRIMREYRETNPTLRTHDPIDVVDEMLLGYQADLEQLTEIAERARHDNARIGAVNSRMVARDRIISLLQSVGVLPHNLGDLKLEIDIRYVAQTLVQVLSAHNVDEGIQRELLAALRNGPATLPPSEN